MNVYRKFTAEFLDHTPNYWLKKQNITRGNEEHMYGCLLVNSHPIPSTLISGREMCFEEDRLSYDTAVRIH